MSITKTDLENILTQGPRTDLSKDFSKASGVALLLSGPEDQLELLFIKRALNPKDNWSGHLAFPGGKKDDTDADLIAACLREVHEEVGFHLDTQTLLGSLDDLQARRRANLLDFYIQPFVFYVKDKPSFNLSLEEVEKTIWVSLDYLMDPKNRTDYVLKRDGQEIHLPGIRFPDGDILWGLTYMMIQNLFLKLKKQN